MLHRPIETAPFFVFHREHVAMQLRAVLSVPIPAILLGTNEEVLRMLRFSQTGSIIFGKPFPLPRDLKTGLHMSNAAAARMFHFRACHLRDMAELRTAGVRRVRICVANEGAATIEPKRGPCQQCEEFRGKKWDIDDVSELPYQHCSNKMGCRCLVTSADGP